MSTAAIAVYPSGGTRNDFGPFLGLRFTVGASALVVSDVGRAKISGNALTHLVKLVDAVTGIDVPGGSATVDLSVGTPGTYVYVPLGGPVTLTAGADYYLFSGEVNGGDQWFDLTTATPSADLSIVSAAYYDGSFHETGVGEAYAFPNFLYTIGGGGGVPAPYFYRDLLAGGGV